MHMSFCLSPWEVWQDIAFWERFFRFLKSWGIRLPNLLPPLHFALIAVWVEVFSGWKGKMQMKCKMQTFFLGVVVLGSLSRVSWSICAVNLKGRIWERILEWEPGVLRLTGKIVKQTRKLGACPYREKQVRNLNCLKWGKKHNVDFVAVELSSLLERPVLFSLLNPDAKMTGLAWCSAWNNTCSLLKGSARFSVGLGGGANQKMNQSEAMTHQLLVKERQTDNLFSCSKESQY